MIAFSTSARALCCACDCSGASCEQSGCVRDRSLLREEKRRAECLEESDAWRCRHPFGCTWATSSTDAHFELAVHSAGCGSCCWVVCRKCEHGGCMLCLEHWPVRGQGRNGNRQMQNALLLTQLVGGRVWYQSTKFRPACFSTHVLRRRQSYQPSVLFFVCSVICLFFPR